MRLLTLTCVVLLCATITQGSPLGTTYTYDFNNLTPYLAVWQQVDGEVTWDSVSSQHAGATTVRSDAVDANDKFAVNNSTMAEQLITSLTNYPTTTSLFNLDSTDTQLRLSWTGKVNFRAGWLVGIWMDGMDGEPNSAMTNELEHVLQFGTSHVYQGWRLRGAAGAPSVTDTTGMPTDPILDNDLTLVTLDVDLTGNSGDGSMSLTVEDLDTHVVTQPPTLQNVGMGLLDADPNYADPSKWTGWYFRNQRYAGGDSPGNCIGYHTLDNLTLEVTPEPATLSLLVLGGLACLRRRR